MNELLERYQVGDVGALARLISLVERDDPAVEPVLAALTERPKTPVVGLTGPPGAGKSTLAAALVGHWRGQGRRVALLAVDPSSTFSGGAALGDRLRLAGHAADEGVFIRSMASRGQLGGLAVAAERGLRLLAGFGFDHVLVETVGVGQAEIEVARLADLVVVVQVPGLGDEMQAIKAGLLEVADIIAVNKADRPGATALAAQLRALVAPPSGPPPPVLCVAAADGRGVPELANAIEGALAARGARTRDDRDATRLVIEAAIERLRLRLRSSPRLTELAGRVAAGELSVAQAAAALADSDRLPADPR